MSLDRLALAAHDMGFGGGWLDPAAASPCVGFKCTLCMRKKPVLFLVAMTSHTARQYFWFYGYPMPLAEGWSRLS